MQASLGVGGQNLSSIKGRQQSPPSWRQVGLLNSGLQVKLPKYSPRYVVVPHSFMKGGTVEVVPEVFVVVVVTVVVVVFTVVVVAVTVVVVVDVTVVSVVFFVVTVLVFNNDGVVVEEFVEILGPLAVVGLSLKIGVVVRGERVELTVLKSVASAGPVFLMLLNGSSVSPGKVFNLTTTMTRIVLTTNMKTIAPTKTHFQLTFIFLMTTFYFLTL